MIQRIFTDLDETLYPSIYLDIIKKDLGFTDKVNPIEIMDLIFERLYQKLEVTENFFLNKICNYFYDKSLIPQVYIMSNKFSPASGQSFIDLVSKINSKAPFNIIPIITINREAFIRDFVKEADMLIHDINYDVTITDRNADILSYKGTLESKYGEVRLTWSVWDLYEIEDDELLNLYEILDKVIEDKIGRIKKLIT